MDSEVIKVILIEDNPDDANLVSLVLNRESEANFDVEHVTTLSSGLDALSEGLFDAVLLDLSLPDASGIETLRKVNGVSPHLPVVVFSAHEDSEIAMEAVKSGAQDYVIKNGHEIHGLTRAIRYAIERKKAERTLKKANEELKRLDQLKTDFTSTVSHELRTPLTSIKNAIDMLKSEKTGPLNEHQAHFLAMAARNIGRLNLLINDILDLSKIESGKIPFKFKATELPSLLSHIVDTFHVQADNQEIRLMLDVPANLPPVYIDPNRIEQVLCNLVNNALKFTPKGGTIIVAAVQINSSKVEVGVSDTGVGLSPEDQKWVFDSFYQVGDQLARTSKGTGLGLSITKKLVEAHGEDIQLESQLGKGSRFYFGLPMFQGDDTEIVKLENEFNQLYHTAPKISVLSFYVSGRGTSGQSETPPQEEAALLHVLQAFFESVLPRTSDRVFPQPNKHCLTLILNETPRDGAEILRKRLETALLDQAMYSPDSMHFVGPVTCPDDGNTVMELMAKLQKLEEGLQDRQNPITSSKE